MALKLSGLKQFHSLSHGSLVFWAHQGGLAGGLPWGTARCWTGLESSGGPAGLDIQVPRSFGCRGCWPPAGSLTRLPSGTSPGSLSTWPRLLSLASWLQKERSRSKCSVKQEAEAARAMTCLGLGLVQHPFCCILLVRAVTGAPDSRGGRKNMGWKRLLRHLWKTPSTQQGQSEGRKANGEERHIPSLSLPGAQAWGERGCLQNCSRRRMKVQRPRDGSLDVVLGLARNSWVQWEGAMRPALARLKRCLTCKPQ